MMHSSLNKIVLSKRVAIYATLTNFSPFQVIIDQRFQILIEAFIISLIIILYFLLYFDLTKIQFISMVEDIVRVKALI